ncbi:MAG TPA: class I SAM-dependent methyltransferase [Kofleriaceae bacterium]|nr:class I SAM-dependent methyltransferase [Kofleriaceae bacterium]
MKVRDLAFASLIVGALAAAPGCRDRREEAAPRASATRPADAGSPPAERPAGASGMSKEAYDRWRRPEVVLAALRLADGQRVADVGAGIGYFTPLLATAVGPRGQVVATDIDPRALSALSALAQRASELTGEKSRGAAPIEVRQVEAGDPGLEPGRYDRILVAQVDHLLADRVDYLRRLRAALAPGGLVVVVNRIHHRSGLLRAAAAAGYAISEDLTGLPGQYLAILSPEQPAAPVSDPKLTP